MDWQLRIALIVIGLLVIGFIIFDFNRRKKAQAEKQRLIDQMHAVASQVDSTGFDITGVGNVRKVSEPVISEADINLPSEQQAPADNVIEKNINQPTTDSHNPVANPPQKDAPPGTATKPKKAPTEQMSLNAELDNADLDQANKPVVEPEMVISLILKAEEGESFKGKDFMPLLLSQGLRHGDMGIFHRHSGAAGKPGPVMYSVANAIKPGTFNLTNIELFETPAFAFFMTIPGPSDAIAAFEGMVKTIKMLKQELGGQILDDSKSVYTEQTYQHQHESLRNYLTKASLKQ